MNTFNGQINISRDLRQNKQTVLGKRDLTDIVFLVIGVGSAVLIAYLLGFYMKIIDETFSVIIGLIPMVIILMLGFRKKAGIRYIFYIAMNYISKNLNVRTNKENINKVLDIKKEKVKNKEEIKRKKSDISINAILQSIRLKKKIENYKSEKIKNISISRKKPVFDRMILVLDIDENNEEFLISEYLSNELVNRIQIRKRGNKSVLLLELEFSFKEFLKVYTKLEYKTIGVKVNNKETFKELISRIKQKINYLVKIKKAYYTKYSKFVNFSLLNKDFIPKDLYEFYDDIKNKNLNFITINDEYINSLDIKNKKVYMLHMYKNCDYREIINEAKDKSEVVIYIKRKDNDIYFSTFFVLDTDSDISISKIFILNKLEKEQGLAKSQCMYHMYNPYNNYRIYKEKE